MALESVNFSLSISTRSVKGVFQNLLFEVCFFMFFHFKKKKVGEIKLANDLETFSLKRDFYPCTLFFLLPIDKRELCLLT